MIIAWTVLTLLPSAPKTEREFWDATPKKIYSQLDIHTNTRKQQVENMKAHREKKNNKNEHTETLKAIKK